MAQPPKSANSAQPSALKNGPVPGSDAEAEAAEYMASFEAPEASAEAAEYMNSTQSATPVEDTPAPFESPWLVENLPAITGTIGGVLGGIGGTVAGFGVGGVPGAIGGAAVGGIAGQSWRDVIETQLLGKPQAPTAEVAKDIALAGAVEGGGQALGAGLAKAGGFAFKQAAKHVSAPVKNYMANAVKTVKDAVEEPVMKMLASKGTELDAEAAGNQAKKLLVKSITDKYGPFTKAYGDLDEIAKITPFQDEARRKFTVELKNKGLEKYTGDNYKLVKKFADEIDAANTGKHLDDIIGQISDAKAAALKLGESKRYGVLKDLQNEVQDFAENEITKLATRVQAGKASEQEIQLFQQIAQKNGLLPIEGTKYAKSIAKDYLSSKDKVRADYADFRNFLEEVGEQAKVKVGNKGPMAFLSDLDSVPSEKLIERMWDPKNIGALKRMEQKTPEVYDIVSRARFNQLLQKASPDGTLNLNKLRSEIVKMPEPTRKLLVKADEFALLNKVLADSTLKDIDRVSKMGDSALTKWVNNLIAVANVGGKAVAKTKPAKAAAAVGRQVVGKTALGAAKTGIELMRPPQEPQE